MEKIMSLSERHQKILELLKVNGIVSVNSLSRQLNVSSVTIRKDLGLLEEKKLLYRSHGGAIQIDPYIANRHVQEKEKQFPEEKKRIGMKAAEMLTPNDAIIIASGTTVLAFARCIPPEAQLTVLTSAMNVAMALLNCQQVGRYCPAYLFVGYRRICFADVGEFFRDEAFSGGRWNRFKIWTDYHEFYGSQCKSCDDRCGAKDYCPDRLF